MKKEIMVKLEHVTKEYQIFDTPTKRLVYAMTKMNRLKPRIFEATKDLSLEIPKGEIIGLIGRNGAGKSTILKMITGISYPTTGTVEVKGRISSLLELGAGFNPELTGMENIFFQADLLGIPKEVMETRVPDILAFAEIGDFIHQPVKNYSSGMFARLAFATAIHVDPDILIVDEVLAVGDIAFQFKCIEKMKEFARQGVTIIFVTHSMMQLYRFCDRAVWLRDGQIVMDGTVEDVVPKYEDSIKKIDQGEVGDETVSEYIDAVTAQLIQNQVATTNLRLRESFTLQIDYELKNDLLEEPYFAISITKDGSNYDIFGIFPQQDRYTLQRQKGVYRIAIEFEAPQLNLGEYTIQFAILEHNGISHLYFGKALDFVVDGKPNTLGLVNMEHDVKITKL